MMKYSELRNSVQIYNKYVAQRFADMADGIAANSKMMRKQTLQEEVLTAVESKHIQEWMCMP